MEARIARPEEAAHARSYITKSRGKVTTYSSASKTRFRRTIWSLSDALAEAGADPDAHRIGFFTLTLPGVGSGWQDIDHKAAFKTWREALRYRFPGVYGYWCKEYQDRGAAHYQGVVLFDPADLGGLPGEGPPYYKDEWCTDKLTGQRRKERFWYPTHGSQDWLQQTWSRIIGQYARAKIEPLRDLRSAYLAKESSKTLSKKTAGDTGRWWGLLNKAAVYDAQRVTWTEITPAEYAEFERHRDAYWLDKLDRLAKKYRWRYPPTAPQWIPAAPEDGRFPPFKSTHLDTSDVLPISTARVGESPRKPRSNAGI